MKALCHLGFIAAARLLALDHNYYSLQGTVEYLKIWRRPHTHNLQNYQMLWNQDRKHQHKRLPLLKSGFFGESIFNFVACFFLSLKNLWKSLEVLILWPRLRINLVNFLIYKYWMGFGFDLKGKVEESDFLDFFSNESTNWEYFFR